MDCIFCKIANGEIPAATLYEDEDFRVILDLGPATKGHALILPKEHFSNLYEIPDELASKAIVLAKKMAKVNEIQTISEKDGLSASFMVGTTEYAVPLGNLIDKDAEKAKANAELEHLEKFLASIDKKLSNEKFTAHAPEKVVEMERKKIRIKFLMRNN